MPSLVIDLSHHNVIPESLIGAKKQGVVGVIHKATESLSYVDSKLQARRSMVRDAGLLWGVYHFIRPADPVAQAEFFVSTCTRLGVHDDNTLWALDYEDERVSLGDCIRFMKRMEQLTGKAPILYSGHVLKEKVEGLAPAVSDLTKYRLWLTHYNPKPKLPQGWKDYWLWQYTDKGYITGINGHVDLNAYDGTPEQLAEEWSGSLEKPAPKPDPEPANPPEKPKQVVIVMDVEAPEGTNVKIFVTGMGDVRVESNIDPLPITPTGKV